MRKVALSTHGLEKKLWRAWKTLSHDQMSVLDILGRSEDCKLPTHCWRDVLLLNPATLRLGFSHPDPAFEQLPALQRLLARLMEGKTDISQDWMQTMMFKAESKKLTGAQLKEMLPKMYPWVHVA